MAKTKSEALNVDHGSLVQIEMLMKFMEKHVIDEVHFDGIVIKKSLHKAPPVSDAPKADTKSMTTEDALDMELFGSPVVKRG